LDTGYFSELNVFEKEKNFINFNNNDSDSLEFLDKRETNPLILNGYSKIQELKLVKIGLASSERIIEWAEKILPNGKVFGEVLNANTLHYKTFKPHKGGLFCERIFGPLKDFQCACGIKQKPSENESYVQNLLETKKSKRIFCSVCDVEYTWSVIRRYQLGYIRLVSPVSHLWYLRTNPSYLSLLLDLRKKDLEAIIYCMQITTLEYYWKPMHSLQMNLTPSNLFSSYKKFLNLNSKANENKLVKKNFQEKKNREKLQKRKTIKIPRQAIYFTSASPISMSSLPPNSLENKIDLLEKSFKLSSAELYPNTLAKISKVTSFLKQKVSRNIKKKSFLTLYKKISQDFYKNNYKIMSKRNFSSLNKISKLESFSNTNIIESYFKFNSKNQFLKNSTLLKKFVFDHYKNSIEIKTSFSLLPLILKNYTIFKTKNSKKLLKNFLTRDEFNMLFSFAFEQNDTNYLDSTLIKEKIHTKNFNLIKQNEDSDKLKREFLTKFLGLTRKSQIQKSWASIYRDENTLKPFFLKYKNISNIDINLGNSVSNEFLNNSLFLYLLFIIQNNNDAFLTSKPISFKNQSFLLKVLKKFNIKNLNLGKWNVDFEQWISKVNTLNFEFLSKFLQTNFFGYGYNKLLKFIEIETVFENTNNNFVKFFNIFLKKVILNFIKISIFQNYQNSYKQDLYNFKIFLGTKKMDSKTITLKDSEILSLSQIKSFFENTTKIETFLTELNQKKKIYQFVKNSDIYPITYTLYSKNKFQLRTNLLNLNQKKRQSPVHLFNNLYTVHYLKGWETEKDWKYFLYYNTTPIEISDQLINNYEYRFVSNSSVHSYLSEKVPVIGANFIQNLLFQYEGFELKKMSKQLQNLLPKLNRYIRFRKQIARKKIDFIQVQKLLQKRDQLIRRLKLLRKLFKKQVKTSSMVLNTLPVLPPDLRPILKMQNQIAASDLNRFYQRILYRNERLKKFLRTNSIIINSEPSFEIKYAQRLLQEAVDNLIQNGKGHVKAETNSRGQPLKSLSEILKGKQGRFRQYLLGKRVDYSGRSVIVVGPSLKIYECGLPVEMAMELFLPFLIKKIFQYKLAKTVIGAKTILKTQSQVTWELLEEVMHNHPILLNRAPTLHRLGIQAFQAKLIEGRAILLHPLVCPAFNADFDGDQMAVHVPITVEARTEAWKLMFSRNHLISPATGESMLLPSQDMVLGCYYLTSESLQYRKFNQLRPFYSGTQFYFLNMKQILQAYLQEKIHLQTSIWLQWNGFLQMESDLSPPLEIRIELNGSYFELHKKLQKRLNSNGNCSSLFVRTTAGRVIFNTLVENCIKNN